jgi:hypothetical protein
MKLKIYLRDGQALTARSHHELNLFLRRAPEI